MRGPSRLSDAGQEEEVKRTHDVIAQRLERKHGLSQPVCRHGGDELRQHAVRLAVHVEGGIETSGGLWCGFGRQQRHHDARGEILQKIGLDIEHIAGPVLTGRGIDVKRPIRTGGIRRVASHGVRHSRSKASRFSSRQRAARLLAISALRPCSQAWETLRPSARASASTSTGRVMFVARRVAWLATVRDMVSSLVEERFYPLACAHVNAHRPIPQSAALVGGYTMANSVPDSEVLLICIVRAQNRWMAARMSSADLVQRHGFRVCIVGIDEGADVSLELLWPLMHTSPDLLVGMEGKNRSTWLIQDAPVGVKCTCQRGRFASGPE